MPNFTDKFFLFPIKTWNEQRYEKEDEDYKTERGWIKGNARLPYESIQNMAWWEGLSRETDINVYLDKGTDTTVVDSPEYGFFYCTWPRKTFEEKLNSFVKKYEELFPNIVEEDLVI